MATVDDIRQAAENDLLTFAKLVNPHRVYGHIHEQLFNWWTRPNAKDNQLCLFPRDHQKAGRLDQKILTTKGWKTHASIEVGDEAIGLDGKPTTVLKTHPISKMSMYEVELDDGRTFVCNEEHIFHVECPSNRGKDVLYDAPLKDIMENYQSVRSDKRNGREYIENRYFIHPSNPIDMDEQELTISPYVLGAWLGDGTSSQGAITSDSPEIPSYIEDEGYACTKRSSQYGYGIKGLERELLELNVLKNKHIPEAYLNGSIKQREALLQGLMDTDGSAHHSNKNLSFSQKDEALIDQVAYLVRSLGGKAKKSKLYPKLDGKVFPAFNLNIWLPDSIKPFRLERKAKRVKEMRLKSAIVNIRYVGEDEARCITVSNEDGVYLTNDFMVTHNSHCLAVRVAWEITRNPALTVLYVSATAALAEKQLYAIKNILTCKVYAKYWPDMVHPEEGKREKWTTTEIAVDHPLRAKEGIRDSTVFAAGLTTNITGFHCNVAALDDVVVPNNVNTAEGRNKVASMYSQLSSIESTDSREWVVGTRYDARDLYSTMLDLEEELFDSKGNCTSSDRVYEVFERVVEDSPERNGSGMYLWPRERRKDGKYFGFDAPTLARKRAKYVDRHQFFAQYYNDPNDDSNALVQLDWVQYYNKEHVVVKDSHWHVGRKRLNVVAAMDFAFSTAKTADFSAIVIIGIDDEHNIYVLDVERFKTSSYREMFDRALNMYQKWDFSKLRCEVSAGQRAVIQQFKTYMGEVGIYFSIDEFNPRYAGTKIERMQSILTPRYENRKMWHYKGGACQMLEEEVRSSRPAHDDIKDALANAIDFARPPMKRQSRPQEDNVVRVSRFGGMR